MLQSTNIKPWFLCLFFVSLSFLHMFFRIFDMHLHLTCFWHNSLSNVIIKYNQMFPNPFPFKNSLTPGHLPEQLMKDQRYEGREVDLCLLMIKYWEARKLEVFLGIIYISGFICLSWWSGYENTLGAQPWFRGSIFIIWNSIFNCTIYCLKDKYSTFLQIKLG